VQLRSPPTQAQFVVSVSSVRQHSLHTYRQLLALLTVGPAHPLHEEPLVTNRTGEPWYDAMVEGRQTLDNVYMVRFLSPTQPRLWNRNRNSDALGRELREAPLAH
jgi:hypothetical protein